MSDELNNSTVVAEFEQLFGISDSESEPENTTPAAEPETTTTTPTDTEPVADAASDEATDTTAPAVDTKPPAQPVNDKQNAAFARMRTENASMQRTLGMLAQTLGIDAKTPIDQLTPQLQTRLTAVLAKQQNIDPQILTRLDQLEQINEQYNKLQLSQKINTSCVNIQKNYGATEDDVIAFLNDLTQSGYDPGAPGADIEQEFVKRNFNKILENRINAAVAAEQARAAKAGSASKPAAKQGQDNNSEPHEINTVEELENYFNDILKH